MRHHESLIALLALLSSPSAGESARTEGWIELFDGKTLEGWRAGENPGSFSVREGKIVCDGPRAHLFYVGPVENADFKNFELQAEVLARPGANSGIFFHTAFQDEGWLDRGYEVQVSNTYSGSGRYRELKKTGSLYAVRNIYFQLVEDDEWFKLGLSVRGKRIQVRVNGRPVVDYLEPPRPWRARNRRGRLVSHGTFALQCHDPGSKVLFRDLRVRPLPDDLPGRHEGEEEAQEIEDLITPFHARGFPLIDYHVHLKGGLTIEEALELSRRNGINYGIAANCGVGFPVTDDDSLAAYLMSLEGQPILRGMQAEGREWVGMFSPEAIARFDYVFTDAMTFTDDVTGKRMRLWIPDEVEIRDPQEFMDQLVAKTVGILRTEPIDIHVNPTYLPAALAGDYDALWTEERMDRVIAAAVEAETAIEINARFRLPSFRFIRRAKAAGVKFSLGTNNGDRRVGNLAYSLEAIRACGLTPDDLFLPPSPGMKAIDRKVRRR